VTVVENYDFYRATRMHSADYAVARCLSVCLSVCPSHAGILSQEAQLPQRDRATLRVIEYFVKSLKITHGHSK